MAYYGSCKLKPNYIQIVSIYYCLKETFCQNFTNYAIYSVTRKTAATNTFLEHLTFKTSVLRGLLVSFMSNTEHQSHN